MFAVVLNFKKPAIEYHADNGKDVIAEVKEEVLQQVYESIKSYSDPEDGDSDDMVTWFDPIIPPEAMKHIEPLIGACYHPNPAYKPATEKLSGPLG